MVMLRASNSKEAIYRLEICIDRFVKQRYVLNQQLNRVLCLGFILFKTIVYWSVLGAVPFITLRECSVSNFELLIIFSFRFEIPILKSLTFNVNFRVNRKINFVF